MGISEWPVAYMLPNLAEDEVLTSIEFNYWTQPHGYGFEEFARRYGDFAIVAVGRSACDFRWPHHSGRGGGRGITTSPIPTRRR